MRSVDQGFHTKVGEAARDESKKFEVGSRINECRYRVRRPGRVREIRKETSEWRLRVALILNESTRGSGTLSTAVRCAEQP